MNVDTGTLERFRASLGRLIGLAFNEDRLGELRVVLQRRCEATGLPPELYLAQLSSAPAELPELARLLTVAESYFFRNTQQLEACMQTAVPARHARSGTIRILSAACASGEEPYSLAILLRESHPGLPATILGMDLNPGALERARRGHYTDWALRETDDRLKARYFRPHGRGFELDPAIRAAVRFELFNLADPEPHLLPDAGYDIVFCRNVLMYFTPDQCAQAVARLTRALAPDGYLFLGHAESLRGISQDFHLCHSQDAFYYQRKPGAARSCTLARAPDSPAPEARFARPTASDTDWFDTIHRASARVLDLSVRDAPPSARPASAAKPARLFDLLRHEQFAQALTLMRSDPLPNADSDDLLLEAVVSAHAGQFDAARALCGRLTRTDELNAGAQYVLALCHEGSGDTERAIHHDRLSSYLDPGFAMPRVHLGLLWRRLGKLDDARQELREARSLLEREDPARLLLFGGGFGRKALLELCDSETPLLPGAPR